MSQTIKSHCEQKTLSEWLCYLESIHQIEIDLGLARISQVAERLAVDLSFAKVITVAGTNGKGTTCAFIENALLSANVEVAVYSSPHIEHFNERLRLNKSQVANAPLIAAFEQIEQARGDISLTYYEYTTLAAFLVLMQQKPQVIILEVGLGGRLDATNMIDADIAVVTSVDLDHQAFLGDTKEKIGVEKAGIMREGKPVVVGQADITPSVIRHGKKLGATLFVREQSYLVKQQTNQWQWHAPNYDFVGLDWPHIPLDNAATAIAVLTLLKNDLPLSLSAEFFNGVIEQTKVEGRTEYFAEPCNIILDVGHNPHAVRYLKQHVQSKGYSKVHGVVGMLSDKDIKGSLSEISKIIDNWYLGTLDVPRGASAQHISDTLDCNNTQINCFDNVEQAFKMAVQNANDDELVLVFGSFFTVAEIRPQLISS